MAHEDCGSILPPFSFLFFPLRWTVSLFFWTWHGGRIVWIFTRDTKQECGGCGFTFFDFNWEGDKIDAEIEMLEMAGRWRDEEKMKRVASQGINPKLWMCILAGWGKNCT